MTSICIVTKDRIFGRYLETELKEILPRVILCEREGRLPAADAYIVDTDTIRRIPENAGVLLCCGWGKDKPKDLQCLWLERPFRTARLLAVLGLFRDPASDEPRPSPGHRSALIGKREIPLTEREYKLFVKLYESNGEYVSRESLHREIWQGEGDIGVVNVYMHYLRKKLEQDGHRLFYASRGKGYVMRRTQQDGEGGERP